VTATIRVYRDGDTERGAIDVRAVTVGAAIRKAAQRVYGLGVGRTKLVERISSRHRLIEWAGVRLHVLEEGRSGPSGPSRSHAQQRAAGRVLVQVYLDATEARCLDALVERDGSKREAVAQAILDAYEALPD